MRLFTYTEQETIESAYEELLLIMKEQLRDNGEMEFSVAMEEAAFIHDLDNEMEDAVKAMYDNDQSPFYVV
jgi:hypothetical protein